jgi:DNA-binding response OmpR family regulator
MFTLQNSPRSEPRVAALFATPWLEESMLQTLSNAGMAVERRPTSASLVAALYAGEADLALVEDHSACLATCLAAIRFRGTSSVPIVAVGQGSVPDMARALCEGASDYSAIGEASDNLVNRLRARIEAARQRRPADLLKAGPCELNLQTRTLLGPSHAFSLTSCEFGLASVMFENLGAVVNVQTLAMHVWGRQASVAKRTIEQHVSRLRHKLKSACDGASSNLCLQAINNVGYRLSCDGPGAGK